MRLGRFAWARDTYLAIGGWTRVWRRLWRADGPPAAKRIALPLPEPKPLRRRSGPLHWSSDGRPLPVCGASSREPWTTDFDTVDCEVCKLRGLPIVAAYWTSTR